MSALMSFKWASVVPYAHQYCCKPFFYSGKKKILTSGKCSWLEDECENNYMYENYVNEKSIYMKNQFQRESMEYLDFKIE